MSRLLAAGTDFAQITEGAGKKFGAIQIGASTLWLPTTCLVDDLGNTIDALNTNPAGTERGLVTRPIPGSTVQHVDDNAGTLTVDAPVATPVAVRQSDGAAFFDPRLVTAAQGAPAAQANAWYARPRQLATYEAVYRLAARPYALSKAMLINTRAQYATIHHAATATKTVRIREVLVAIESNLTAAIITVDLARISTAPATGNPAITPKGHAPADTAGVEATCLALPTTAATEDAAILRSVEYNLGVTAAGSVVNPPPALNYFQLYSELVMDVEEKPLEIRAATLEGYAVTFDVSAATTIKAFVIIRFTEE